MTNIIDISSRMTAVAAARERVERQRVYRERIKKNRFRAVPIVGEAIREMRRIGMTIPEIIISLEVGADWLSSEWQNNRGRL